MKTPLFLCIIVLCMATACKKSTDATNTALITGSTWTFQKFEYQQKDGTWIPDPNAVNADKFTVLFNTNGTFFELHQINGYTATGNWALASNATQLTVTGGIDLYGAYTVSQLTTSSMLLTVQNYPAGTYSGERLTFGR